ncbi:MAG: hypothetical protein KDK72_07600 [Chlamydiia bacterium]|nr:hypothetical protein [Chlamydiia bacterium]
MSFPSSEYETRVAIWDTSLEHGVGHVSMVLRKGGQPVKYLSLRPSNPYLVNPLTIPLPTRGVNCSSVDEDNRLEGKVSDRNITFPLSEDQFNRMAAQVDVIQKEIANRTRLYQIHPRLSLLHLGKQLSKPRAFQSLAECPFSGESIAPDSHTINGMEEMKASHCALTVADALDAGGITAERHLWPWIISPSDLGDQLENLGDQLEKF